MKKMCMVLLVLQGSVCSAWAQEITVACPSAMKAQGTIGESFTGWENINGQFAPLAPSDAAIVSSRTMGCVYSIQEGTIIMQAPLNLQALRCTPENETLTCSFAMACPSGNIPDMTYVSNVPNGWSYNASASGAVSLGFTGVRQEGQNVICSYTNERPQYLILEQPFPAGDNCTPIEGKFSFSCR